MHGTWRMKTLLAAAIATTLVGSVLVYFGVGSARYAEIGWFEYIREMVEVVDAVSVEPAGFAGLILVSAGVLVAAFLLGFRWSTPRRALADSAERTQTLTYVWWGAAALTAIGLIVGIISITASPPYFPNHNPSGPGATFLEDPALLSSSIRVASATFVGAATVWAGLLVMGFLLGRYGRARSGPSALLAVAVNRSLVWWSGVALAVIGLAAVVTFRVTAPAPVAYDGVYVPLTSSAAHVVVTLVAEDVGFEGSLVGLSIGTALALLGLLIMSLVIGLSNARRRAPITTAADD